MKARHKFGAKPTTHNGRRYASKLEARYAQKLALLKSSGTLLDWLEQVPIQLPGGIVYRVDFLEFWADGRCVFTEVKGVETPAWKMKRALLEESRPHFELQIVRKV